MTTEKYQFITQWQPILSKLVAPLFILSIIFLIVALVLLIVKKYKKIARIAFILCPICFVAFYSVLSISSDWHRNIMVHDTFFDGEGTPISEIADKYKNSVESIAEQPVLENSSKTESEFVLISEYAEQIDENNDILVRYGTIDGDQIILGYFHFDGTNKKSEWKKIMAIMRTLDKDVIKGGNYNSVVAAFDYIKRGRDTSRKIVIQ